MFWLRLCSVHLLWSLTRIASCWICSFAVLLKVDQELRICLSFWGLSTLSLGVSVQHCCASCCLWMHFEFGKLICPRHLKTGHSVSSKRWFSSRCSRCPIFIWYCSGPGLLPHRNLCAHEKMSSNSSTNHWYHQSAYQASLGHPWSHTSRFQFDLMYPLYTPVSLATLTDTSDLASSYSRSNPWAHFHPPADPDPKTGPTLSLSHHTHPLQYPPPSQQKIMEQRIPLYRLKQLYFRLMKFNPFFIFNDKSIWVKKNT